MEVLKTIGASARFLRRDDGHHGVEHRQGIAEAGYALVCGGLGGVNGGGVPGRARGGRRHDRDPSATRSRGQINL